MIQAFTIRVYGLLFDPAGRLLVSDEYIRGNYFTKLPGGGMEFGEGTRECLKREFKEETGLDVSIGKHIYTTDYFQPSAFNPAHQMVGIYYLVDALSNPLSIKTAETPFAFSPEQVADPQGQCESFRWIEWDRLSESDMHLPIDKKVVNLLKRFASPSDFLAFG